MSRWRCALTVSLLVAACVPTPAPTLRPTAEPPSAEMATLTVTGSGVLCGPWWFGCGALLLIEAPGWTMPEDWAPSADDTQFEIGFARNMEETRVTGIRRVAQDRVAPGAYRLVVIKTESPDTATDGSFEASVLCSSDVDVLPGTRTVRVDVDFASGCTIAVSIEGPSAPPSASLGSSTGIRGA